MKLIEVEASFLEQTEPGRWIAYRTSKPKCVLRMQGPHLIKYLREGDRERVHGDFIACPDDWEAEDWEMSYE